MSQAGPKHQRWHSVVANIRAIRGGLAECLKLSDQLHDREIKSAAIRFVTAMEYLGAALLGERRRADPNRPSEKELLRRLREEVGRMEQLLDECNLVVEESDDTQARKALFSSVNLLNQFAMAVDRKAG